MKIQNKISIMVNPGRSEELYKECCKREIVLMEMRQNVADNTSLSYPCQDTTKECCTKCRNFLFGRLRRERMLLFLQHFWIMVSFMRGMLQFVQDFRVIAGLFIH